jgi:hypothetical protein
MGQPFSVRIPEPHVGPKWKSKVADVGCLACEDLNGDLIIHCPIRKVIVHITNIFHAPIPVAQVKISFEMDLLKMVFDNATS